MKIVIEIPNNMDLRNYDIPYDILKIITDGKPLPEHHGRIIDESKITQCYAYTEERISKNIKAINTTITHTDAPTIIEADKECEEE